MSRYQISPPARQDLIDIRDFIAKDNRTAARKVLAGIRAAWTFAQRSGFRASAILAGIFRLIIYRPNSKPIEVVRVLHGARDISAIL